MVSRIFALIASVSAAMSEGRNTTPTKTTESSTMVMAVSHALPRASERAARKPATRRLRTAFTARP